jgi:hypothetical protein
MSAPHRFGENWWQPDKKYSLFRRNYPYDKHEIRDMYCTDVDWVEWRNGRPVAILETTRCYGKPVRETMQDYLDRAKGFQCEVTFTVADALKVKAYLVLIDDPWPEAEDDYGNTTFYVCEIDTKDHLKALSIFNGPDDYINGFLRKL